MLSYNLIIFVENRFIRKRGDKIVNNPTFLIRFSKLFDISEYWSLPFLLPILLDIIEPIERIEDKCNCVDRDNFYLYIVFIKDLPTL